jgi:hypothetical protein
MSGGVAANVRKAEETNPQVAVTLSRSRGRHVSAKSKKFRAETRAGVVFVS